MKARDPIQFSSIIEYYASERVLKRPKDQLMNQFTDLITICEFLTNRIPPAMKVVKDSARAQHKNVKDLGENVRRNLSDIFNDPKSNKTFFIESAYDEMSHFCSTKQIVGDYVEKTIAEKEMKLKFLQSENLPSDFIWYKPIKQGREHNNSIKHKQYAWHSYFNTKFNMLEISSRKYRIFVSFKIVNSAYMWTINQIQLKTSQELALWLMVYFEDKVVPQLKAKYGEDSEVNMLACINNYAYYLQILQLNKSMCMLSSCAFFSQKISYTHKNQAYELHFSAPQSFTSPQITITHNEFTLQILFLKKQTSASFKIGDLLTLNICEHFKYSNCMDVIQKFAKLIELAKKYKAFQSKISAIIDVNANNNVTLADINEHIVCKLNGQTWLQSNFSESTEQDTRELKQLYGTLCQDDLYLAKKIESKLIYCAINSQGQLTSGKVGCPFLQKLLKFVPSVTVLLNFVCIIETVCEQNGSYECELDYYEVNDKVKGKEKVMLINRKKSVVEDQMIKVTSKGNVNEEQNFNSLKSLVEFSINFTELSFYRFQKDPEQREKYEKQEWKQLFNLKYKQPTLLSLSDVLDAIRYVQDNTIYKYVVERKLKNDSKSLYRSLI